MGHKARRTQSITSQPLVAYEDAEDPVSSKRNPPGSPSASAAGTGCCPALEELDKAMFSWFHVKAILISGIGFFTDAYDLFLVSLVVPMIGFARYPELKGKVPLQVDTAIKGIALCGTLVGQIAFGILGDHSGRKRMYGVTLITMIAATVLSVATSYGPNEAMIAIFCFWRLVLGVGIGGDYPLSATISSEYANRRTRGAMIAAVFSMQGLGIIAASLVAMVMLRIFKSGIERCTPGEACATLEHVWRLCVGLGAVPAAATYYLRMKLPETPRYTAHVKKDVQLATKHIANVMKVEVPMPPPVPSQQPPAALEHGEPQTTRTLSPDSGVTAAEARAPSSTSRDESTQEVDASLPSGHVVTMQQAPDLPAPQPSQPPATTFTWSAFAAWCRKWKNLKLLLGTCSCWFLLDVAFYANNLFTPTILTDIGYVPKVPPATIYDKLQHVATGNAIVALMGTVPGYYLAVLFIERMGRKPMQAMGFAMMTIFLAVMALLGPEMRVHGLVWLYILLYAFNCLFSNFGPNTTTFIVPGECFPTRFRSTCHGLSAASGKAGAIIGAFGFGALFETRGTRVAVGALSCFTFAGLLCTSLIVETTGRSLEELSGEGQHQQHQQQDDSASESGSSSTSGPRKQQSKPEAASAATDAPHQHQRELYPSGDQQA